MNREQYIESIPKKYSKPFIKAFQGRKAAAIQAKCLDCVGIEDVVTQVGGCTASNCPLYEVRPYRKNYKAKTTAKGISPKSEC
jgi:hypothetical protein